MPPAHEKIPDPEIAEPPALAMTAVPTDLVERCVDGERALLTGSGLSARSELSKWGESIVHLLEWTVETRVIDPSRALTQRAALSEDRNVVADNLVSAFQQSRDLLIEFAKRHSLTAAAPSPAHHLLRQISFAAVLMSNLDDLLERAYQGTELEPAYIPQEAEALLEALSARRPFLLKLYGTLEMPPTVIFSPAEYKALISSHVPFTRLMEGLFFSRTLLFLGCSLDGITDFLNSFPFRAENPRRHYALVGVFGTGWQARAEVRERRYNIEVIPFDISEGYGAVDVFLQELAARTEEEKSNRQGAQEKIHRTYFGKYAADRNATDQELADCIEAFQSDREAYSIAALEYLKLKIPQLPRQDP